LGNTKNTPQKKPKSLQEKKMKGLLKRVSVGGGWIDEKKITRERETYEEWWASG